MEGSGKQAGSEAGGGPEPQAVGAQGLSRLRTKSGVWIGGAWARDDDSGRQSYAAGYPDEQDLYLAVTVLVDADTGEFAIDERGIPQVTGGSLLIRWSEVEYLEFFDR